ncbi:MAG TPA: hypothetical protein DF698_07505 [Candidatus Atribacteria bacterium]|nr:hypothetical protein [Candidatus Atribacteria bacterium]
MLEDQLKRLFQQAYQNFKNLQKIKNLITSINGILIQKATNQFYDIGSGTKKWLERIRKDFLLMNFIT